MDNLIKEKSNLMKAGLVFVVILSAYFTVKALAEIKSYGRTSSLEISTITLSGHGEVIAVPDIATISFTISKVAKTAKEAQEAVAQVEQKALEFLRGNGVEDKDIKTENASVYPKYEWKRTPCPLSSSGTEMMIFPPCISDGKNVLLGYEANESITMKVRKVDDAGEIMQGLGAVGVSNLNGPNFAIDNEDGLKMEARKKAIEDARGKAKILAKDLGVRLGKIVSFSENGYDPYPVMYGKAMMAEDAASLPPAPELPKGENTISSDVSITYEIR
ncbi:hypothetical protein A3D42_01935 [Candidatus Nomurabacteria bacterium RIFCSPHIGHO2_02_FULL_41_18]|uniref:SIMPL domain-containing protein n=1 Tax=Candidatus Nomurabacteria bacterium RIFCSPHIGHO2_02_FULL_41_18 TaxID=1801754 RepID=A0A1F6W625_9BACT|nr:MAG: hypothetical protein A2737_00500 [Candidatus Nomurabacteria bacterium RIFCSPHIGHO2_01_FULL_41_71]OGI77294.1 MAG: hypothetical protein A3D42_01935 [Candidatus Nomurabacteria bacterium RIFCSPHIGHO2_02_FULL_41_18]OGI89692.1 MAG: hypothetical protein A3B01_02660 [Candidatus Nomurabacteria bacterium RIFCSPLOWO2_01_FULL_41_52b]OGJ00234.1 MAG: hypothetical protein A3I90_01500 [Candidatus Nomurabacteria bacterium RIFCSPLOWO2_02_FULL_41_9]